MKRDVSQLQFRNITGFRGDSMVCPQPFGGDIFAGCSMGCWWCFCREMEQQLYNRYFTGWSREIVRPCNPDDYKKLFDFAFGSDRETDNWNILCLRHGLPYNMGSKAETFAVEDLEFNVVPKVLELFREYDVPVIFETKSHYIGLSRYLDIVKDLRCAVIVAVMGGSDTLNYVLEPGAPPASMRWKLVQDLNRQGVWTAVRWEPVMWGINSQDEILSDFATKAKENQAKHVSLYNYRTSNVRIAKEQFEQRGFNYVRMVEGNLDETWTGVGTKLFQYLRESGVKASTPDFVNFPFDSSCESCCGVDGLFVPYEFTYQHACRLIMSKGFVCWDDMEAIEFRQPEAYERMKTHWNGGGNYYSLKDSPQIRVIDRDSHGMNIYGKIEGIPEPKKTGLFF